MIDEGYIKFDLEWVVGAPPTGFAATGHDMAGASHRILALCDVIQEPARQQRP